MVSFSEKNAHVPSSLLFLLSSGTILSQCHEYVQSKVCIHWKVSRMQHPSPIIVRGNPCEGWGVLTRLMRT